MTRLAGMRSRLRLAVSVSACLLAPAVSGSAYATDFVVSKTADTADGTCDADCSLREAIIAANASPGADRILLGSGQTYVLTRGPADAPGALVALTGDLDLTDALTIEGNGSAVDAALLDRVFDIQGTFAVTINSLTMRRGLSRGFLAAGGGVSIRNATVVMNNSLVEGATQLEDGSRDVGGGISAFGSFNPATGIATLASLTLNDSTVSLSTGSSGGGIACVLCTLTITRSILNGNVAGADGGAIALLGNAASATITGSALTGSQASGRGGALAVPFGTSTVTLSRTRIVENAATSSVGTGLFTAAGTITATNNWWGCNFGPGATGAGCAASANTVSGTVTTAPFLVLRTSASPIVIDANASSTVTADLTFNSASADTAAGGTILDGTPATFAATLGSVPAAVQPAANGKVVVTYVAGPTGGTASVSALVDRQTISTTIDIISTAPAITGHPANQAVVRGGTATFTGTASGDPAPGLQWQASANGGSSWANLTNAAPYSGVTTGTLTVTGVASTLDGYLYRVVASNGGGSAISTAASLSVDSSDVERIAIGLGQQSANGGWIETRAGMGGAVAPASWIHLPWDAYNATGGGLRLAAGDVDGDGLDEIVAGLGTGGGGWMAVFDDAAHGHALLRWIQVPWAAYNAGNGEVWPAVGDLDGDGRAEIVAGLGSGGAGWYAIFDDAAGGFAHLAWRRVSWADYNASGSGATHPAIANVDGVGAHEIILGLGTGGGGYLEVVDGAANGYAHRTWIRVDWAGYNTANGTTFPAAGDLDGDGRAEIVAGLGTGGAGWLAVLEDAAGGFASLGWLRTSWGDYNASSGGETHPAIGNVDDDGRAEIVIGLGVIAGAGGWFEVLDDSAAGFARLGWRKVDWAPFNAAGGATFPAIGRFR